MAEKTERKPRTSIDEETSEVFVSSPQLGP